MSTAAKFRCGARERVVLASLAAGVIAADQVTKAVVPVGAFIVNAGGAFVLPSRIGDLLWRSETIGALSDTAGAALLLAAARRIPRSASPVGRYGAVLVVAGLLSNLLDRLGVAALVHPGVPRGAIDWIPFGARHLINLADVFILLGAALLAARASSPCMRIVSQYLQPRRCAVAAGIMALAVWAFWWGANRQAVTTAQHHATDRAPASILLISGDACANGDMDWLSYRSTGTPYVSPRTPCP
jgi:lipoprotein signal peptidase